MEYEQPTLLWGKEGVAAGGLDGLGSLPGSSRSRRPRSTAPNPQHHFENWIGFRQWLKRTI
jgi:hypothetical protein